jgi:3-dehydroquinate synthase
MKIPEGFIVTDNNVARLYGNLLEQHRFVILDAGEQSKSVENYLKVAELIKDEERIISLGGGMVGDLAGFVASTYKRGIGLIHVPTTLLAMVDSSIGGKNGVNLGLKKNCLGTIYEAENILLDLSFLDTLPEKEFKNGTAEIIKYAFVMEPKLIEKLKNGLKKSNLKEIVNNCRKIKMEVVKKDPLDKGVRHILNFGHTIGHAIELLLGLSHGEAISIGMVKEWELAGNDVQQLKSVIVANGLPTNIGIKGYGDTIIRLLSEDKKGAFVFAMDKQNFNLKIDEDIVLDFIRRWKNSSDK